MSNNHREFVICNVIVLMGLFLIQANLCHALQQSPDSLRRLISLIDYIAGDYQEAVQSGKIVNDDEYQEMQDFAVAARNEFTKVKDLIAPRDQQLILSRLDILAQEIAAKDTLDNVQKTCGWLRNKIFVAYDVQIAPKELPDYQVGKIVYEKHCAQCHGVSGLGDGPAAKGLNPSPRNFHEEAPMTMASPFKFYNVLVLGIEGTAMASFAGQLSEQQLWSAAFYTVGLRHENLNTSTNQQLMQQLKTSGLSLDKLSSFNDQDLTVWLNNAFALNGDQAKLKDYLTNVRTKYSYLNIDDREQTIAIAANTSANDNSSGSQQKLFSHLETALKHIDQSRKFFNEGLTAKAEEALLDSYLLGFEPIERHLLIENRDLVYEVERNYLAARSAARAKHSDDYLNNMNLIEQNLTSVKSQIEKINAPQVLGAALANDFMKSFVIILREGFEAFLIVIAMLAAMKSIGLAEARKWIHGGWLSAIALGFVTFFVATYLISISTATQEVIEAVCSLLAAGVLFYVSFWMLSQAERSKWDNYLKSSARAAATKGKLSTLFFLAFIAVYREAAETVLFYQAILTSSQSISAILFGFVVGCASVLAISWLIVRFGLRLPLKQFFIVTSFCMVIISIILVGKGVNELIESGYLKPTLVPYLPSVDILGIYPSWETLGAQVCAVLVALSLWFISKRTRLLSV